MSEHPLAHEPLATDNAAGRFEAMVGMGLRVGVMLSAALILVGFGLLVYPTYTSGARPGAGVLYPPPRGSAEVLRSISGVLTAIASGDPVGVLTLGILLLMATPVIQVIVSGVNFALRRNWVFTAVAIVVLAVIAVSAVVGATG